MRMLISKREGTHARMPHSLTICIHTHILVHFSQLTLGWGDMLAHNKQQRPTDKNKTKVLQITWHAITKQRARSVRVRVRCAKRRRRRAYYAAQAQQAVSPHSHCCWLRTAHACARQSAHVRPPRFHHHDDRRRRRSSCNLTCIHTAVVPQFRRGMHSKYYYPFLCPRSCVLSC